MSDKVYRVTRKRLTFYVFRYSRIITVPKGFKTDGVSIPYLLQSLLGDPFNQLATPAAILHDFLYSKRSDYIKTYRLTRLQADIVFYDIMLAHKVSKVKAIGYFVCVRLCGWLRYKR